MKIIIPDIVLLIFLFWGVVIPLYLANKLDNKIREFKNMDTSIKEYNDNKEKEYNDNKKIEREKAKEREKTKDILIEKEKRRWEILSKTYWNENKSKKDLVQS